MKCYICESPAEDITPPGDDRIVIRCSAFGDFEITGSLTPGESHYLLDKLLAMDVEDRKKIREQLRRQTPNGQRPCIHSLTTGLLRSATS